MVKLHAMSKETRAGIHRLVQQAREYPFNPPYLRADMRRFSERVGKDAYVTRLTEFDTVCERFHDVLAQEEDGNLPAIHTLLERLKGRNIPSFALFVSDVRQRLENGDRNILSVVERIGELSEIAQRQNQESNFSRLLISSYSQLFRRIIFPEMYDVIPIIDSAVKEVISNNFGDTVLAQDLGLQTRVVRENRLVVLANLGYQEAGEVQMVVPKVPDFSAAIDFLIQHGVGTNMETRERIEVLGLLQKLLEQEPEIGKQALRLLASSLEEDTIFAETMLEFYDDSIIDLTSKVNDVGDNEKGKIIYSLLDVIMDEDLSEDTKAFWIMAPWIYSAMAESPLFEDRSDKEILSRILLWAKDGKVTRGERNRVHLQGLEFLSEAATQGRMFDISSDPNSESIRAAREIGKIIAKKVLVKDEFDPDKAFLS